MYLPWLQIRHRWHDIKPNVSVGDLVLLHEPQSETEGRRNYPKTVTKTCPDARGCVRSVAVKLANGRSLIRDVHSTVHLEEFENVY